MFIPFEIKLTHLQIAKIRWPLVDILYYQTPKRVLRSGSIYTGGTKETPIFKQIKLKSKANLNTIT